MTTTMTEEDPAEDLMREIIAAHEAGDTATLTRLQAEYRSVATVERVSSAPIELRWESRAQRSRSATLSASPRSTQKPRVFSEPPKVSGGAGLRVVLTAGCLDDFRDFSEIADGREAGGWLFGFEADGELVVERATLVRDRRRLSDRLDLDVGQLAVEERHFAAAGWSTLGDWHSHTTSGLPPSIPDKRGWSTWAHGCGRAWLGLVLEQATTGITATTGPDRSTARSSPGQGQIRSPSPASSSRQGAGRDREGQA